MARLCPLFSGSSGNSYYIGSRSSGVLIDAGRSAKQLENMLKTCGIDPNAIQAVLVTHEHTDHISGLRVFAARYGLPVIGTEGTLKALGASGEGLKLIRVEDGMETGGMRISHFLTRHDCAQSCGYVINTEDNRKFTFVTDVGHLFDEVKENLLGADMAVIESNHDREMLRNGPYPQILKQRILSEHGHLSNDECASFLPELVKSGTRRFLLAHLSRENNTPTLALDTSLGALARAGYKRDVDFVLEVAPVENTAGRIIIF